MNNPSIGAWIRSLILFSILFIVFTGYTMFYQGSFELYDLNRVIADVSMLIIGFSIAVVGTSRFLGFGSSFLPARRQLGTIGFVGVLLHGVLIIILPRFTLNGLLSAENIVGFLLALLSFVILTIMILASVSFIKTWLGIQRWLILIKLGIWAYIFGLLHASIKIFGSTSTKFDFSIPPAPAVVVILIALCLLGIYFLHNLTKKPHPQSVSNSSVATPPSTNP